MSTTPSKGFVKEQDQLLPIANIGRIMKQILPPNSKISKEAKETMQECVSEFISFVTGEASDKCHKEKRKTINGDDLCWALSTLGFEDYAEPLYRYLQKYRELEGERVAARNQNKVGPDVEDGASIFCTDQMMNKPLVPRLLKFEEIGKKANSNLRQ